MQLLRLGQFHVFSGLGFLKFVIFAVFIRVISCVRTKLGILRVLVLVRVFCHYNIINLMIFEFLLVDVLVLGLLHPEKIILM